ncbi:hypothetical protein ABZ318_32715 [Streptomyces sp. NPDC006197]|uniref:hypothetical protein n=1 Tax=Streptomyces sp. NPDC006197 TaxID=3156685 RepID=UPI0033B90955
MNPDAHAQLYGPTRLPPPRRGAEVAVTVVAAVLWSVALLLLQYLGFVALWAAADSGPTEGIPLSWVLICLAVPAVPIALFCTPVVRRRSVPVRALVTGLATFAIAVGLLIRAA